MTEPRRDASPHRCRPWCCRPRRVVGAGRSPPAARPARSAPPRPDLTIVGTARYDVQPDPAARAGHGRPDPDQPPASDTTTKRYFFDDAFLAVLPGTSGLGSAGQGAASRRSVSSGGRRRYTLLRLDLAQDLDSGKLRRVPADVRPRGSRRRGRRATSGSATRSCRSRSGRSPRDETPGSSVTVVFPKGYDVRGRGRRHPQADDRQRRTDDLPKRVAGPAARLLRLFRRRPARRVPRADRGHDRTRSRRSRCASARGPTTRPGRCRVRGLLRRSLPVLGDRIGLPWPRVRRATHRRGGRQPLDRRLCRHLRPRRRDRRDRLLRGRLRRPPRGGPCLVQRRAPRGPLGQRGVRVVLRHGGRGRNGYRPQRPAHSPTSSSTSRIPLNGWGAIGTVEVEQEDYAYAAGLTLARLIAERAGEDGLRAIWADVDRAPERLPAGRRR